jgi:cytidine deaminase
MVKIGEKERKLLETAAKTMDNAHVLWGFKVGAAVLAEDGRVYEGCNVENWVSGLGVCAERCAIDHAVLHGNRKIKAVALVMDANSNSEPKPCGACLQYIYDFAENAKVKVVMTKAKNGKAAFGNVDVKTVGELLPFAYHRK